MIYFKKIFTFMRPYKYTYGIGMFLYNVQGFAGSFIIGLVGMSVMAGIVAGDTRRIVTGTLLSLLVYSIFVASVGVGIYIGFKGLLAARRDLKQALFRSYIKTGLEMSQATHSGEGIAKINTEADLATGELYWNVISSVLRIGITFLFSSVALFVIDWRMGLAAVGVGLLAFVMQTRFIKPLAKIGRERLDGNTEAVKTVSDIFQGAISIRAFNMQEKVIGDASQRMNVLKLLDLRQAFISMWQNLFTTVKGWLAVVTTFGLGGWLVANGHMEFPTLLLALPLLTAICDGMGGIGQTIADLQAPLEATKRIFDIIDNTPVSSDKGNMAFDGSRLKIKGLNFKYQNADTHTLHDIDLDINVGEMVAFVGPSGSGKSTILRILVGFYERENLGLTLGGMSSDMVSVAAWRRNFAYVDQSCKLFDMTIRENISMGKKGETTEEEIIAAARQAFAHDFIEQLEEKYDAPCGEKGASLSGGQKQRIAIARALIKGAPILVFDEATSALDASSEQYVMETIASLRNDRTILITTHNLANITNADKIVVLNKGRIVDVGKHDELMERKGLYYKLFNTH
ncbi:MAG: ABC transporter ATP-binding protein/permease [Defluviitaleaceae bacterium]|nr:ABC transporter ATP-binding protein/permease [Defluviitaleaceae bacterium]